MEVDQLQQREFISLLGGALAGWPLASAAQAVTQPARVGVLAHDLQPGLLETFRDELRNLGYVEGTSINIEVRNAEGIGERLPALANELRGLKVDVIVAVNTPAAKAAKNATKSVPIVIMRVADPVKSGLVASLAHPGGNVTGLSFMPDELGAKGVEVFREGLPGMSRMGCLYSGDNPGALVGVNAVESRAKQLGMQTLRLPVADPKDYGTLSMPQRALGLRRSSSWMMEQSPTNEGKFSTWRPSIRCLWLRSTKILRMPVRFSPTGPA